MINSRPLNNHTTHRMVEVGAWILLPLALLLLFIGVDGIIENKSPAILSTVWSTVAGFFAYLPYHLLIIAGAMALTFSIWLLARQDN